MLEQNTTNKPSFYPASYLVMTVTSLLFLGGVIGLGAMLINYWINGVSDILNDKLILFWIASLAVVTPYHLRMYRTVRSTDKSQVTTFSLRFAYGLLGVYLFILVGSNIVLGTWLVALLLNALLGTGEFDKSLLATSLSLAQAIAWLMYATRHFVRSRFNLSSPKIYMITISVLSALIVALSLAFPVLAYRGVARDAVKSDDLWQISQSVGDYVDEHNALPAKLSGLEGLNSDTQKRLSDYEYTAKGDTAFGIFGYTLCATFARSNDKGHDIGFGFESHAKGRQCFARTTISFTKLNQDLAQGVKNVTNGAASLQAGIQSFLLGAKSTVDQEITGVEAFASTQVKQLEGNLEGLEGGTTALQQAMGQLEGNLSGLQGDTGDLAQDFAAVEKFLHDLGCLFGGCNANR